MAAPALTCRTPVGSAPLLSAARSLLSNGRLSRLRYIDKTTGQSVSLHDSATSFLAVVRPTEAERIDALLDQRVFAVSASRANDGVILLSARSDAESPVEIQKALERLRTEPWVQELTPALVDEEGVTRYVLPGTVIVQFVNTSRRTVTTRLTRLSSKVIRAFRKPGLYEVALPSNSTIEDFIAQLNEDTRVQFAEPSYYGADDADLRLSVETASGTEAGIPKDDTSQILPWNLTVIKMVPAWRYTRGSRNIGVGVVDGVPDMSHDALRGHFLTSNTSQLIFSDDLSISSHATNIAGLIAGQDATFTGVAPGVVLVPFIVNLNAQLYAMRADAISFAAACARTGMIDSKPIARLVLSCSWRTAGDVTSVRLALQDAVAAGIPIVCSAGNTNSEDLHYPSRYGAGYGTLSDGLIPVAATTQSDIRAPYSSYSPTIALAAPGGDGLPLDQRDIECPEVGNQYGFAAGTSIAVPHVAGVVALMLSLDPSLPVTRVKSILTSTADSISAENPGFDGLLGSGRLNAYRALQAVADGLQGNLPKTPVPDSNSNPHVTIEIRHGPRVSVATS